MYVIVVEKFIIICIWRCVFFLDLTFVFRVSFFFIYIPEHSFFSSMLTSFFVVDGNFFVFVDYFYVLVHVRCEEEQI